MAKILKENEKKIVKENLKSSSKDQPISESETQEEVVNKNDEERDLLDILLDMDNKENISLIDNNGKEVEFQQMATIPMEYEKETRLYALLKPVVPFEGSSKDEVFVFMAGKLDEDTYLLPVTDKKEAETVFDKYLDMVDEMKNKKSKNS